MAPFRSNAVLGTLRSTRSQALLRAPFCFSLLIPAVTARFMRLSCRYFC